MYSPNYRVRELEHLNDIRLGDERETPADG